MVYSHSVIIVPDVAQSFPHKLHIHFVIFISVSSKQISVGVGIPMMVVGALIAFLLAPTQVEFSETAEFVGSLIGILGVVFFVAGLFYSKTPVMH